MGEPRDCGGENIRWISEQIGHADPAFTLRTYAHLMPEEEIDLSFADFGIDAVEKRLAVGARKRPYTAPASDANFLDSDNPCTRNQWHAGRDSNPRPSGSKPDALSS